MIRFSLRIPADLHERVTAQAAADRRSLNSEILYLLEAALSASGSPGGDRPPLAPLHGKPDFPPQAGGAPRA
ncbi:Arc family DNA-binding protein [Streptomyces sasae]|uniref:Arc family DNA-binding protein n=1 Tax=Streptomyces sasae TaxID=1266772 RepID=UPI00292CCA29|nr:Arc family DNA-binding protein [Streptomyces sasae]